MSYEVEYALAAERELKKLDKYTKTILLNWVGKNLVGTDNPRRIGKALVGDFSGLWRYRVGDYRIIAKIMDSKLIILIVTVGHRKEICKT